MTNRNEDLDFALSLASRGEEIARRYWRSATLGIRTKADGSPVTDADVAVERELTRLIDRWHPDDAILGEEFGASAGGNDRRWIIDPIDGTANFLEGRPDWAVLIALEVKGRVEVGVMAAPALDATWWAARGLGARRNGVPLHVREGDYPGGVVVSRRAANLAGAGVLRPGMRDVIGAASRIDSVQTFWPELLVAEGIVDIDASPTAGRIWDLAPRQIIVEEAGGVFSDFSGQFRCDTGSSISCSTRLLSRAMLTPEPLTRGEVLAG